MKQTFISVLTAMSVFLAPLAFGATGIGYTGTFTGNGVGLTNAPYWSVINVKLPPWNAYGDGIHDDSGTIQPALIFAAATSGTVYAPKGKYLIANTISLPGNSTGGSYHTVNQYGLLGDGPDQTLFISTNLGMNILQNIVTNQTDAVHGLTIKNIGFQGPFVTFYPHLTNETARLWTNVTAVAINMTEASSNTLGYINSSFLDIDHCFFNGFAEGMSLDGIIDSTIQHCQAWSNSVCSIACGWVYSTTIQNCTLGTPTLNPFFGFTNDMGAIYLRPATNGGTVQSLLVESCEGGNCKAFIHAVGAVDTLKVTGGNFENYTNSLFWFEGVCQNVLIDVHRVQLSPSKYMVHVGTNVWLNRLVWLGGEAGCEILTEDATPIYYATAPKIVMGGNGSDNASPPGACHITYGTNSYMVANVFSDASLTPHPIYDAFLPLANRDPVFTTAKSPGPVYVYGTDYIAPATVNGANTTNGDVWNVIPVGQGWKQMKVWAYLQGSSTAIETCGLHFVFDRIVNGTIAETLYDYTPSLTTTATNVFGGVFIWPDDVSPRYLGVRLNSVTNGVYLLAIHVQAINPNRLYLTNEFTLPTTATY